MSRDQIICLLNNSDKYSKENMGHHIHTLEAEDARLLLESSPEDKDILHQSCTCAKGIYDI